MKTHFAFALLVACSNSGNEGTDAGLVDAGEAGEAGLPVQVTSCWTDTFDSISDYAVALRLHPSGDIIAIGDFSGEIDFKGTKLTAPPVDASSTIASWVARLRKSDGTVVWARLVGDTGQTRFRGALTVDPSGNVVIGGFMTGTVADLAGIAAPDPKGGGYIARLDGETGSTLVARPLDVSNGPAFLVRASDGSYAAGGGYSDYARLGAQPLPTTASSDIWIARVSLDDATTVRWAKRVGDGGSDSLLGLAVAATDDVVLSAIIRSSGSLLKTFQVAKLAGADGATVWSKAYSGAKDIDPRQVTIVGDEAVVIGLTLAAVSLGGDPLPVGKGETTWLARYAMADGAHRASFSVEDSLSGDGRPAALGSTPTSLVWYLAQTGLHHVDPKTGAQTLTLSPGARDCGDYDIAARRWYSGSQGSIRCTEAH